MVGVSGGDAAGAAAAMADWPEDRLTAVWALLDARTTVALDKVWPQKVAAA